MERFLFPGRSAVRSHRAALRRGAPAAVPALRADGGAQCAAAGRAHQRSGRDDPLHSGGLPSVLPGPILAVSHDRFFLDKLAEPIFEVAGRCGCCATRGTGRTGQAEAAAGAAATAGTEKPRPAQERPREKKLKFSFNEQREFATALTQVLAQLEAAAEGLRGSAGALRQRLCAASGAAGHSKPELEAALEEKTERWMYLTELKEKIDAQNG